MAAEESYSADHLLRAKAPWLMPVAALAGHTCQTMPLSWCDPNLQIMQSATATLSAFEKTQNGFFRSSFICLRPDVLMARKGSRRSHNDLPIQTSASCCLDHVVFLNRNHVGPAQLREFDKQWALDWLTSFTSYGKTSVREAELRAYETLLKAPVWELCYTDLDDAVVTA